jgi:hypothetical protein
MAANVLEDGIVERILKAMQTIPIQRKSISLNISKLFTVLLILFCELQLQGLRADQIIFDDAPENNWVNYSWATVNLGVTSPVHSGSKSISVSCTNYQAFYMHHNNAFDSTPYSNITFWIYVTTSASHTLTVAGTISGASQSSLYTLPSLAVSNWTQITVPLSAIGVANNANMDGFWIQSQSSGLIPTFYLDDITLVSGSATNPVMGGTNAPISILVDAQSHRQAISPMIYGVAFASSNQLLDLNCTMNRSGGNSETRYNWQANAHNLAADWYFESYPDASSTPGATADAFVADSVNGGAQAMISIPMIGWAPKLGSGRSILPSYSVAKYGAQASTDPYLADAGNGITFSNGLAITTNNPNDANIPAGPAFEQGYVQHLMSTWGSSTNGGVKYYIMDNEHSLWSSTHQDIHPIGPTMQEIWGKMLTNALMVKSNDPNALVVGPEEWGWPGYLYSGYDQQWSGQHGDYNAADYPDRQTNGGWDYMPWLLNQFHQHDLATGKRLLDYFTLHCYPQEGSVYGNAIDPATELLRNQSTRQFWDPNYVDPSWINSVIDLIPLMKSWVASYYPGTKTGITEYSWGAEPYISGATAQADLLGIFGRQGLDLATRWTVPADGTPTYLSFKMYRNYDGNKSTFGDTSVFTTVPNPDVLSAFGATRSSDGAMTLMVVNKDITNASPFNATVTNFNATGTAQRWQLTSNNVITQLSNLTVANGILSDTVPSQSITLYVLPGVLPFSLQKSAISNPPGQVNLQLNGQSGLTYVVQSSTDLVHWTSYSTNKLVSNSLSFSITTSGGNAKFYRGMFVGP